MVIVFPRCNNFSYITDDNLYVHYTDAHSSSGTFLMDKDSFIIILKVQEEAGPWGRVKGQLGERMKTDFSCQMCAIISCFNHFYFYVFVLRGHGTIMN